MKCKFCDKSFNAVGVMIRHLKILHSLERSYTCIHSKCLRQFVTIPTLQKHVLVCPLRVCPTFEKTNRGSQANSQMPNTVIDVLESAHENYNSTIGNNVDNVIDMDETCIQNSFLRFVGKMYSNNSITRSVVQDIVHESLELVENLSLLFSQKLKLSLPVEFHSIVENCLQLDSNFQDVRTEYKRFKLLTNLNLLIHPESFVIGEISDNKNRGDTTVWTKKPCTGQFVPMRRVLKMFLELPNVYEDIKKYMQDEISSKSNAVYTSIFHGKLWSDISEGLINKIVIPLYLYYDDFEVCDPLSSAKGIHKVGGLYYAIAAMPPKYSSNLDNIFLAQFMYSMDHKEFKNEKCFYKVIDEFKYLHEHGILISVNGQVHEVHFVLLGILGDNLGLHSLFGFNESFVSEYFCRFCRIPKEKAHKLCVEDEAYLRNVENFEQDVKSLSHGVKAKCIFNDIPQFHNTANKTCDLTHDIYLGVGRYDMARIINHCVQQKYFTLDRLNDRLKYFDYNSEVDRGNKISSISAKHIHDGCLITTAAEMSALISYFGIIVGDLVHEDDPVWEFYLTLYEITDLITSSIISEHDIGYLRQLIKVHNKLYIELFEEHLKPKFHFLTHYPNCIKIMGPVKYLSCAKFESFHQKSKKYAHVVASRVNIIYTLTMKIQLELSYRFLSNRGLGDSIEFGRVIGSVPKGIFQSIDSECYEVSSVKVNGSSFKPDFAVHLCNDHKNDPVFGIITRILNNAENAIYLIYTDCVTIGFDNHMKGYLILRPCYRENARNVLQLKVDSYMRPMKIHVTGDGQNIICRRDLS